MRHQGSQSSSIPGFTKISRQPRTEDLHRTTLSKQNNFNFRRVGGVAEVSVRELYLSFGNRHGAFLVCDLINKSSGTVAVLLFVIMINSVMYDEYRDALRSLFVTGVLNLAYSPCNFLVASLSQFQH